MNIDNLQPAFFEKLQQRLLQPLPGFAAHQKMINQTRLSDYYNILPNEKTRKSAVLILFYPDNSQWHIPMILRPSYEGVHSGQVGFPGGKQEDTDADLIATALRETYEEIGIDKSYVNIVGVLSEIFVFASNFMLLPVVGYVSEKPAFLPDSREVAQLLQIPVKELFEENRIKETTIRLHNNISIKTPYYDLGGQIVWGASALILSELIAILTEMQ
jgi:8-oxo-dGTP pyrophosphatase MutT (NUDIX family)